MPDITKSVTVTLAPASVSVGGQSQATWSITTDGNDNSLDTKAVVWSSLTPSVATVDPLTGVVRAVAAGAAVIRAMVGTVAGAATVTVTAPFVVVDAAQEAAIKAFPVGTQFVLRGPTMDFTVQVSG